MGDYCLKAIEISLLFLRFLHLDPSEFLWYKFRSLPRIFEQLPV